MSDARETVEWFSIDELPDDFDRPGGQRHWLMRDREGKEFVGKRATFNNSGFLEVGSNNERWPVSFCA